MTDEYIVAEIFYNGDLMYMSNERNLYQPRTLKHMLNPYNSTVDEMSPMQVTEEGLEQILTMGVVEYKNDRSSKS